MSHSCSSFYGHHPKLILSGTPQRGFAVVKDKNDYSIENYSHPVVLAVHCTLVDWEIR